MSAIVSGDSDRRPNILRRISRFLKARVVDAGIRHDTPEGTPSGGVASPILAHIYVHYASDFMGSQ